MWLGVGPQIGCLAIPHLRALLGLVTLDLAELGFVAIVVAATWLAGEFADRLARPRREPPATPSATLPRASPAR